jgi:hypothetical protein
MFLFHRVRKHIAIQIPQFLLDNDGMGMLIGYHFETAFSGRRDYRHAALLVKQPDKHVLDRRIAVDN